MVVLGKEEKEGKWLKRYLKGELCVNGKDLYICMFFIFKIIIVFID